MWVHFSEENFDIDSKRKSKKKEIIKMLVALLMLIIIFFVPIIIGTYRDNKEKLQFCHQVKVKEENISFSNELKKDEEELTFHFIPKESTFCKQLFLWTDLGALNNKDLIEVDILMNIEDSEHDYLSILSEPILIDKTNTSSRKMINLSKFIDPNIRFNRDNTILIRRIQSQSSLVFMPMLLKFIF